jgi:hypothetical protein
MVSAVGALMAAMMALMAAPAMAQVVFGFDDDDDDNDFRVFDFDDDDDDDRNDFDNRFGFNDFGNLGVENESESGPVDLEFAVENTGDYASQCVPALQFGNTGNFNNAPTFGQFGSGGFVDDDDFGFFDDGGIDDFEPGGIEFSASPEVAVDCSNSIQQSSAASSY